MGMCCCCSRTSSSVSTPFSWLKISTRWPSDSSRGSIAASIAILPLHATSSRAASSSCSPGGSWPCAEQRWLVRASVRGPFV